MQPTPSTWPWSRAVGQRPPGTGHLRVTGVVLVTLATLGGAACERSALTDGLPDGLTCPPCEGAVCQPCETGRCTACHGSSGDPAPPRSASGSSRTSERGVGAHQAHLKSSIGRAVACAECHAVPTELLSHPDPLGRSAQVVFGPTAAASGASPSWDRASATCTGAYCHGATLPETETRAVPVWTRVDGTQKACTSCHGNPPGGSHPASTACENCHGTVMGPGGAIVAPTLHIDGKVDVGSESSVHPSGYANPAVHGPDTYAGTLDCRRCHGGSLEGTSSVIGCDPCHQEGWRTNCIYCHGGTLEGSGAPPRDLRDGTATTSVSVGSHTEHVSRTNHRAFACTECHASVTDVMTSEHLFDSTPGVSEVVFGNGLSPAGQYVAPGCSDIYCHGTGLSNGSVATFVPAGTTTCQSCHPAATQSASHAYHATTACSTCHLDVVTGSDTIRNPDLHVNGVVEVRMAAGTWIAETHTCSGSICHRSGDITW